MKMLNKNTQCYTRKINNPNFIVYFSGFPPPDQVEGRLRGNDKRREFSFAHRVPDLTMIGFGGFPEFSDQVI